MSLKLISCIHIIFIKFSHSLYFVGQYPAGAVAGSPTGVAPSSQHQMPITSQPQPDMYGVQMNGSGMGAEYQTGSNVGANVQSQVSSKRNGLNCKSDPPSVDYFVFGLPVCEFKHTAVVSLKTNVLGYSVSGFHELEPCTSRVAGRWGCDGSIRIPSRTAKARLI